jgi:CheY-like chemotaxis protein
MACNFNGKRVMVVEGDVLLASELAAALEAANAVVLGPCHSLEDVDLHLAHSDLAVLDVQLCGRSTFALADRLAVLDVPFLFFTAHDRDVLPSRFARVDCITRPQAPLVAVQQLCVRSREMDTLGIVGLIPLMRARARGAVRDPQAADRLVELALQLAIKDPAPLPSEAAVGLWLVGLMDQLIEAGHGHLLN